MYYFHQLRTENKQRLSKIYLTLLGFSSPPWYSNYCPLDFRCGSVKIVRLAVFLHHLVVTFGLTPHESGTGHRKTRVIPLLSLSLSPSSRTAKEGEINLFCLSRNFLSFQDCTALSQAAYVPVCVKAVTFLRFCLIFNYLLVNYVAAKYLQMKAACSEIKFSNCVLCTPHPILCV